MQHPHPVPLRRRPRRISRRALVLLRRRRLPKRRSLFQLLTRGRGIRSSNRQQEVVTRGGGDGKEEMEMEVVNMKLFWENRWIMEENQRLRKRALALRHENQILLTQLHHHHDPKFVVIVHDINSNSTEDAGDDIASADGQLPAHQHPHQHHGHPGNPWKL